MTKKAKVKKPPLSKKDAKIAPRNSPDSILKRKPVWRFALMDINGPWGWGNIVSAEKFIYILHKKLKNLESMTWGEIERKDQSHLIPVAGICSEARKRLDEIKLDDRDILYSLRLTGSERLWGIRDYDSFYLLWWDPNHSVYPVSKKHT